MTEHVIVRPYRGNDFPATVLDRRDTTMGREVLIEYQSVLGVNTTWLNEHQVRPQYRRCADTTVKP